MKPFYTLGIITLALLSATTASAKSHGLTISVEGLTHNAPIPARYALCKPTADGKSTSGANQRPTIRWSGAPKGTDSFAVFVMDPDVPADFSDASKEGVVIDAEAERRDFFHYGVVNIPPKTTRLNGSTTNAPVSVGTPLVNDLGQNNYVPHPADFGGPCPPWNDARLHHYHFIVLALDEAVHLSEDADENTAKAVFDRLMEGGHVLASATSIGTYTLNPALNPKR